MREVGCPRQTRRVTLDPFRLGGEAWARRTRGALTRTERRRLTAKVVAAQVSYAAGLVRLATGRVPARAAGFAPDSFVAPDSSFAREAEDAWTEQPSWVQGTPFAAEAAAVPDSRFAVLVGLGAVPLIRHAPRLR